jgi:O-antigen/teichoic acid export membrane protein
MRLPKRMLEIGASNLVVFAAGAVSGILVARQLGPSSRGDYATALIWPALLTVLPCGGLSDAATFFSSNRRAHGYQVARSGGLLARRTGYVIALLGFAIAALPAWRPEVRVGLLIGFGASPLVISGAARAGMLLQHASSDWFRYRVLGPIVQVGLIGGLTATGRLNLLSAVSATTLGSACAAVYVLSRPVPAIAGKILSPQRHMRSYALRACAGGVPQILNARLDQLVMSFTASAGVLGNYAVATTFASLPLITTSAVGQHMFASVSALPDIISRRRAARWTLLTTGLIALTSALILGTVAYVAIPFIFGHDYDPARLPAVVLLFASVGLSISSSMGQVLKALGHPGLVAYAEIAAAIVTFVGLLLVVDSISALNAAWVSLAAYSMSAIALVALVYRSLHTDMQSQRVKVEHPTCPASK